MFHPNEAAGILICVCTALLCIVIGLVLFSGRGAMMIAGFNTLPKEKQKKINEKALCKAVGIYVMAIGIIIGLIIPIALLSIEWLVWFFMGLMILSAIPFVIYINISQRFKNNREEIDTL